MRRSRALLAISLVYAILGVATVASAGETFLSLRGETGDFVVGPKRLLFTPDGNTFNVQSNFHNGVSIVFQTPSLDQFWSLDFAAPNGQRLTRGAYEGATRYPFEASSEPGLWLAGDGVGCNTITGRFQVQQAAYASDGTVLVFAATFEQHCDGAQAAAFGEIRFNADPISEFSLPAAGRQPVRITTGADGNLWFTEQAGNQIGRLIPGGGITEFPVSTSNSSPLAITLGPDGNVWFTEFSGNKIGRITPAGVITEFTIPTASSAPAEIAAGLDGNLWFTEASGNKIGRITPMGAITEFPLPTAGSAPTGITAGPDGNVWFTEQTGNRIGRITPVGTITEFPVPTAGRVPFAIAAGPDGNLWFTEQAGGVGRATPTGMIVEFPANNPDQITSGPDGNLWFTEHGGNNVGRITPAGVVTEFPIPTASSGPDGITTGPDGSLWFAEQVAGQIGRLTPPVTSATAVLTSPTPQTTLPGTTVTFDWTEGSGATEYFLSVGTTGPGSFDVYAQSQGTNLSATVSALPNDGRTVYVRLWSKLSGTGWSFNDYTYTAFTPAGKAELIGPVKGTTLAGTTVTFNWSAGLAAIQYWLSAGTTGAGSFDMYSQGQGTNLSATVSGLPSDGRTVYVRLWTQLPGVGWVFNDYTYTAIMTQSKAVLTGPVPGTTLTGTTVTFSWSAGLAAIQYWLSAGTTGVGSFDVYSQGQGTNLSATVSGLPNDGRTVYVRLWTQLPGTGWAFNDYTYTAITTQSKAVLAGPAPGTTLAGTTVTFSWKAGLAAIQYWLSVGTTGVGSFDGYSQGQGTNLSATVSGLPSDGRTVYVRLWTQLPGVGWVFNDYTYTAITTQSKAVLTGPVPGTTLAGTTVTFNWRAGLAAIQYWLSVGTTGAGSFDVYSQGQGTNLSATVNVLPNDGRTVYVRLWTQLPGTGWGFNDYSYTAANIGSQVRFLNNLLICNPNCMSFTARLTASEGYTWFSTSGTYSDYQLVRSPTLSNFTAEAVGFGVTVNFAVTFNLTSGERYALVMTLDAQGNPVLSIVDEGAISAAATKGRPETQVLGKSGQWSKDPSVHFTPIPIR